LELTHAQICCERLLKRLQEDQGSVEFNATPDFEAALALEDATHQPRLREEFLGFGPLQSLMDDESVSEIVINGSESIWFEQDGRLLEHKDRFLSEVTLNNFRHRMCAEAQLRTDLNVPCGDSQWQGFRVHLIDVPLAERLQITLRRQPKAVWTFQRLRDKGWATDSQIQVMRQWIHEQKNILIIGATGAGKTSVLNACLQEIPRDERLICLEDTSELFPPKGASCKLLTRFDVHGVLRDFTLADLVRQSLRMRPSRLLLGEVRSGEAKDLLLALATGHRGSLGTLHAADARQALLRLEMLVQLGASQWNHQAIRQLIQLSIDGIIVAGRQGERRCFDGLFRISSLESFGFLVDRVC
jgi:pilus assembly protein CpaF